MRVSLVTEQPKARDVMPSMLDDQAGKHRVVFRDPTAALITECVDHRRPATAGAAQRVINRLAGQILVIRQERHPNEQLPPTDKTALRSGSTTCCIDPSDLRCTRSTVWSRLPVSSAAGQEPVDLGQEVFPGGIAFRQQVVAAVEWDQTAVRD